MAFIFFNDFGYFQGDCPLTPKAPWRTHYHSIWEVYHDKTIIPIHLWRVAPKNLQEKDLLVKEWCKVWSSQFFAFFSDS
jgi:hypothetical protein